MFELDAAVVAKKVSERFRPVQPMGDLEGNPIVSAKDLEERFFEDDFHWHWSDKDVCSEELAIEYLLIHRINDLFAFHERLDRFSWDNSTELGELWQHKRKIKVLKYLLEEEERELKGDIFANKKELGRFENDGASSL